MLTELEKIVSDRAEYLKIENYLYDQLNLNRKKMNKQLSRHQHQQTVLQQTAIEAGITILNNIKRS